MSAAGPPQGAKGGPLRGQRSGAAASVGASYKHVSRSDRSPCRDAARRRFCSRPRRPSRSITQPCRRPASRSRRLLESRGVAPGATVSFMLENGASAATVFLGAMYGGYVVSPINLHAQDAQLEYTLAHSDTRIVFASAGNRERLEAVAPGERRCVRHLRGRFRRHRIARCDSGAPPTVRAERPGNADVHVGHDRTAERRAAVAREHARGRSRRCRIARR